MIKRLIVIISLTICIFGCKKDYPPKVTIPEPGPLKISVVSGAYQTGALGSYLRDSIVVKVSVDQQPAKNIKVEFKGSGCNSEFPVDKFTKADGTASYGWQLVTAIGDQKLTAVIINNGKRVDSVTLTTQAYDNYGNVHYSSCTPPDALPMDIRQLSTGRLLSCFSGKNAIRYSDDYGINWHPLKTFSSSYYVTALVTTPNDEIFAVTQGDGIFYSKDAGLSWVDVTPPTFNKQNFPLDINYTKSGKLMITTEKVGVFITADNGKTWTTSHSGLPQDQSFNLPNELNNGDMYVMDFSRLLYKSTNGGVNWVQQPKENRLQNIYVDKNGWMYKGIQNTSDYNIVISKDDGKTFLPYTLISNLVDKIKVDDDGNIFYFNIFNKTSHYLVDSGTDQPFGSDATISTVTLMNLISQRNWYIEPNPSRIIYFSGHHIAL